ncbi:hypothetical protein AX15_006208 [Amanita polypyramis BW_CC]|nr:hypothetical protein AX15_006208 [Amanita polypyramis BW_CC]
MFSKVALIAAASLAIFVSASPVPGGGSSCSTGPIQCCNSVEQANSLSAPTTTLLGLLGVEISSITAAVGVGCIPVVGSACSGQTVCCQNNNFSGLVSLGCNNISL